MRPQTSTVGREAVQVMTPAILSAAWSSLLIDPDRPSTPTLCAPHHAARHAHLRASATPKG